MNPFTDYLRRLWRISFLRLCLSFAERKAFARLMAQVEKVRVRDGLTALRTA
jgi:hypothetical protein